MRHSRGRLLMTLVLLRGLGHDRWDCFAIPMLELSSSWPSSLGVLGNAFSIYGPTCSDPRAAQNALQLPSWTVVPTPRGLH